MTNTEKVLNLQPDMVKRMEAVGIKNAANEETAKAELLKKIEEEFHVDGLDDEPIETLLRLFENMRNDPFEKLNNRVHGRSVNPKAIYQPYSHEASVFNQKFGREKKLDLLICFVLQGYDLHAAVRSYLEERAALDDACRISEIRSAFEYYYENIVDRYLDGEIALGGSYSVVTGNEYKFYCFEIAKQKISLSKRCSAQKVKELFEEYVIFALENGKVLYDDGDLIDVYKEMIKAIERFMNIAKFANMPPSLSIRSLITAFVENDKKRYEFLRKLWQIDLEKDLTDDLQKREDDESIYWSRKPLYELVGKNSFLTRIKPNILPSILTPIYEGNTSQLYNVLLKKIFPKEDHKWLQFDEDLCRERLLDYAEKIVEILWLFNKPYFDEPVYYTRCYFRDPKSKRYVPEVFEKNLMAICIQDDEEKDKQRYDDLLNGRDVKYDRKLNYIHRFFEIVCQVKTKDVLVINSYLGYKEKKIGLVKKGSEIISLKKEGLTLYCLQMKSVYCTPYPDFWENEVETLIPSNYPVLKSLILPPGTINPVKDKNKAYSLYYGYPI